MDGNHNSWEMSSWAEEPLEVSPDFRQLSILLPHLCDGSIWVPDGGCKYRGKMAPFIPGPGYLGRVAVHVCVLPRSLWASSLFLLSAALEILDTTDDLLFHSSPCVDTHSPVTAAGLALMIISVSCHLGLHWWKALHSRLKCISLISFFVRFFFPSHPKLGENNSTCSCFRPSSSLPPFTLPCYENY